MLAKLFAVTVCCLVLVGSVAGADLKIYPQILNLNSEGVTEPVEATIDVCIPAGYTLTGWDLSLSINDVYVVSAQSVVYYTDEYVSLFYAYFDRVAIRDFILANGINGFVTVQVTGSFSVSNEVETIELPFSAIDVIEVVAPGNKL